MATHCNTLQHPATHCNIAHTDVVPEAPPSDAMQNTATHYHTLQHTATHCNTLQHIQMSYLKYPLTLTDTLQNTLQHTATHCNTLQHTATHISLQPASCGLVTLCCFLASGNTLQTLYHTTATHCNTLHHTTPHCTTLRHTAPRCTRPQHTAPHHTTLHHIAPHCTTLQLTFPCSQQAASSSHLVAFPAMPDAQRMQTRLQQFLKTQPYSHFVQQFYQRAVF